MQHGLTTSVGDGHRLRGAVTGSQDEAHHPLGGRQLGVLPKAPDVHGLHMAGYADVTLARLANRHLHRVLGDHVAERPVALHEGRVRRLLYDLGPRRWDELSVPDMRHVAGQVEYAVGVDGAQVGGDQGLRHPARVPLVRARRKQYSTDQTV